MDHVGLGSLDDAANGPCLCQKRALFQNIHLETVFTECLLVSWARVQTYNVAVDATLPEARKHADQRLFGAAPRRNAVDNVENSQDRLLDTDSG